MEEAKRRSGNDALDTLFYTQPVASLANGVRSAADKRGRSFVTTTPVITVN